jgi:hypothetical protein
MIKQLIKKRTVHKKIVDVTTRLLIPCVYIKASLSSSMEAQTVFFRTRIIHTYQSEAHCQKEGANNS